MTKTRRAGLAKKRRRGGRKTIKRRGGKRRSRVTRRGGKRRSRYKIGGEIKSQIYRYTDKRTGKFGEGVYDRNQTDTFKRPDGGREAVSEGEEGGDWFGHIIDGLGEAPEALGAVFGGL